MNTTEEITGRLPSIADAADYEDEADRAAAERFWAFYEASTSNDRSALQRHPLWRMLLNDPELAYRVTDLTGHLSTAFARKDLKELVVLAVARTLGCHFAYFEHTKIGVMVGLPAEKLADFEFYRRSDAYTDEEKTIIDLAYAALEGPVPAELFDRAKGFLGTKDVLRLIGCVANWAQLNVYLNCLEPRSGPAKA